MGLRSAGAVPRTIGADSRPGSPRRGWASCPGGRVVLAAIAVLAIAEPAAAAGWAAQTSSTTNNLLDIQALDANTAIAVGQNGTILKTTDGGQTWVAMTSGTTQSLNGVYFLDANNGWAVGGTILKTTNGGNTWTVQTGGASFNTLQDVRFPTPSVGIAVGTVGSQGFLRTTDGGQTWAELNIGSSGTNLVQDVFFLDDLQGWAVGFNAASVTTTCDPFGDCFTSYGSPRSSRIWKTTDGGVTWTSVSYQTGSVIFLRSVYFIDASTGWLVGDGGLLAKTTNGGASWSSQTSGTTTMLHSVSFVNATTGWMVGADGVIRTTTDGGASWSDQGTISSPLNAVSFADSMTGWIAGNSGKIVKTTDGGGPACASATYGVSPASVSLSGGGGTGSLSVTAPGLCSWTASSDAFWLSITSGFSGAGSGSVAYSVAQNQTGASRTGRITVRGQVFTLQQAACGTATYSLSPTASTFLAEGGSGSLSLTTTTAEGCWNASSDATWLKITSGLSGGGSGAVGYSVAPNLGGPRTGHITVAGKTFNVDQLACGPACPALNVTTFAGSAGQSGSADDTGSAARFNYPQGVAVDGAANVYVADSNNRTIRKISPGGAVTTLAGLAGQSGSADGTGSAARFSYPQGVAVDAAGNVYVADRNNNTIRKVSPAGEVTTLAGLAGQSGSADGTGSAARFNGPQDVAVDGSGNVYVADNSNSTIRKVTPAGVVTTFAGVAGQTGSADGTGSAARFNFPRGVAVDGSGNVYVADTSNYAIRKISPAGVVTTSATFLAPLFAADAFPGDVAVTSSGSVYVCGVFYEIWRLFPAGAVSVAGLSGSFGSADGVGSAARFNVPSGVAVDASGNVYVGDSSNNTIRRASASAPIQLASFAGDNQTAFAGSAVATPPAVIVRDSQSNPVSGVSVMFNVASGGGSITGALQTTGSNGVATVGSWTLGPTPGGNTLMATSSWLAGSPVALTATGLAAPPTLSINDVTVAEGNGGNTNAVFTVGLSAASAQTVMVNFATADGAAVAGPDYTPQSGTLTFMPGALAQTMSVPILGDALQEPDETFSVTLSGATGATIARATGTGTIGDDDGQVLGLRVSIDDRAVAEGGALNAAFRVFLSGPSTQTISVDFETAPGTAGSPGDYAARTGTLTFTPGRTQHGLFVPIVTDTASEGDETFYVNLKNATNATILDGQAAGTIADPPAAAKIAMYRSYNKGTDYHFFTTDLGSKNFAVGVLGFQDESSPIPFYVWNAEQSGTTPLFRIYNPNLGRHFYTASAGSRDFLMGIGAVYEKEEGFVYPLGTSPVPSGATELFLLYNNNSGTHLFSADANQKNAILSLFQGVWVQHTSVGYVFTAP